MTHNKKNPYNNEWNSDGQDDTEAHPNRVIPIIVHYKDKGTQYKTNYCKNDTANIFPFPCNNKKGK